MRGQLFAEVLEVPGDPEFEQFTQVGADLSGAIALVRLRRVANYFRQLFRDVAALLRSLDRTLRRGQAQAPVDQDLYQPEVALETLGLLVDRRRRRALGPDRRRDEKHHQGQQV